MQGQINPKIVGATIIGFAFIGGAYTINSLQTPRTISQPAAIGVAAPARVAIAVTDENSNGIEDWRDEFVTTKTTILSNVSSTSYEQPNTLTGQMSIRFFGDFVTAKGNGPFGKTEGEVIQHTVDNLAEQTNIDLYDTPDIEIMESWDEQDVRNYANTLAAVLIQNSSPGTESELTLLHAIVVKQDQSKLTQLQGIVGAYEGYRDDTLKIPVPSFLAKEHLDLINTCHAIHEDVTAMAAATDDPALALLHLKRYQDDAGGLALALQNLYLSLEPYAHLIQKDDPAALFVVFSPDIQR
jgi:hypothetical protein